MELTTGIIQTCIITHYWFLFINMSLHTHTLLEKQGVLYSRPTAIIPL